MSPGALINQTLVTSGTMTNRIDRLAERDLVRREADPHDRRGVLVVLTVDGRKTVDEALTDLLRHEQDLLAGLSARQREALAGTLRDLITPFDKKVRDL
jgi:DNA-binding MarR family transcriptional regulator